jgi:hypothetical protein
MKTVRSTQEIRQERLQFLHREAARQDKLKERGWVLESTEFPDPGLYEVWIKVWEYGTCTDKFGARLNFDGHSWYGEMWNWWDEEVYAWRTIK